MGVEVVNKSVVSYRCGLKFKLWLEVAGRRGVEKVTQHWSGLGSCGEAGGGGEKAK